MAADKRKIGFICSVSPVKFPYPFRSVPFQLTVRQVKLLGIAIEFMICNDID